MTRIINTDQQVDNLSHDQAKRGLMHLREALCQACHHLINLLPDDKILPLFKLKAFADDKLNAAEMVQISCDRVEKVVGKGEIAGFHHFLLFSQCFQKASMSGS